MRGAAALALGLLLVAPLVPLAVWSVARGWFFPDLLPARLTWEAWSAALSPRSGVPQALALSAGIAAASALLAVLVGLPAARALGMRRFRGSGAVRLALLAPVIVPGIAIVLGLHGLFLRLGLANTVPGVILVHLIPTLPYAVLAMAGTFAGLDPDLEAQARSLGARPAAVLRHVTLPAILPGIVAGGLFAFLVSWAQYALTLVIGGGKVVTLPLLLFSYATSGRNDLTGAIGILYLAPGALALVVSARLLTGRGAGLATMHATMRAKVRA
ncbi:ABC transporter permease [Wenxinia saemankumensis]|uniref:Putative spermidine/putrescine transport system permease protein n=1 Tax=Wenxinia saemankumensis TaxID=1447782 RepID=A0A1M6DRK5_9RHOB|nr:ABC transporter permease subunit [Wenxinia saemankumensis]SHI75852.1 putative spermidine/putrescine transport system permease protein [Wenxinia saemankumensis]